MHLPETAFDRRLPVFVDISLAARAEPFNDPLKFTRASLRKPLYNSRFLCYTSYEADRAEEMRRPGGNFLKRSGQNGAEGNQAVRRQDRRVL